MDVFLIVLYKGEISVSDVDSNQQIEMKMDDDPVEKEKVPQKIELEKKEESAPTGAENSAPAEAPVETPSVNAPAQDASAGTPTEKNTPPVQKTEDGKDKFFVLVIEEKSDLRAFYTNALSKTGIYDVTTAATPREGLVILEDLHPKINFIVFDWIMPEITGSVLAQKIRSDHRFNHIEMIVCSNDLDQEDLFLMVELDIHNVMTKSNNVGEYVGKINEAKDKYLNSFSLVSKLKDLQTLLDDVQIEKCDELARIPEIEKEISSNPRYVHLGGEVRIFKKQYDEAIGFLKDFLTKNKHQFGSENLKSLSTLGKAMCLSGKYDEALSIFYLLESKSPKNLSHKIMAGDALLELDNLEEAEGKYKEVLEADPDHKKAMIGMVKTSAVGGDMDTAKTFFSKIEGGFESRYLAGFFNNRGVAMVRKGDIQGAIVFYENSIQFLDKGKGLVYFNLGMAYIRLGNLSEAVRSFQAAINSKEAPLLKDKTILKELKEKGVDKFLLDYKKS